jgi:hypothetical protein
MAPLHGDRIKHHLMKLERGAQEGWLAEGTAAFARYKLAKLLETSAFNALVMMVVFANAISIGLEAELTIGTDIDDFSATVRHVRFYQLNLGFLGFFSLELVAKIVAHGPRLFWTDSWNRFDFVIILAGAVATAAHDLPSSLNDVLALRLLRVLRVVRVVQFLENLNLLATCFVRALRSVFWVSALMVLFLCVVGQRSTTHGAAAPSLTRRKPCAASPRRPAARATPWPRRRRATDRSLSRESCSTVGGGFRPISQVHLRDRRDRLVREPPLEPPRARRVRGDHGRAAL